MNRLNSKLETLALVAERATEGGYPFFGERSFDLYHEVKEAKAAAEAAEKRLDAALSHLEEVLDGLAEVELTLYFSWNKMGARWKPYATWWGAKQRPDGGAIREERITVEELMQLLEEEAQ